MNDLNINLNKKLTGKEFYEYKLYLLVRNDLPSMNTGKAIAQAAHAANQFIFEHGTNPHVKRWQSEGIGFGTTITLSVNMVQLDSAINTNKAIYKNSAFRGIVTDTTYPYIVNTEIYDLLDINHHSGTSIVKPNGDVVCFRNEDTCGYIFVVNGSDAQRELTSELNLYP